jgi:ActR/RegA family two-component response regulator
MLYSRSSECTAELLPDLSSKRVLVTEDDYMIAFALHCELVDRGAKVIGPVSNLDWATALLEAKGPIDAAVIDINLQGELAFTLVDSLVQADIPVVFYTGYGAEVLPYRLRHIPRFEKPAPTSQVVQELAGLLMEHQAGGKPAGLGSMPSAA